MSLTSSSLASKSSSMRSYPVQQKYHLVETAIGYCSTNCHINTFFPDFIIDRQQFPTFHDDSEKLSSAHNIVNTEELPWAFSCDAHNKDQLAIVFCCSLERILASVCRFSCLEKFILFFIIHYLSLLINC